MKLEFDLEKSLPASELPAATIDRRVFDAAEQCDSCGER